MNIRNGILSSVEWYSNISRVERGKAALQRLALGLLNFRSILATSRYGSKFIIRIPEDHAWTDVYFRGTYETGTMKVLNTLLQPGDIVFDVGANIGWYTTHMAQLVRSGQCHAFEPLPTAFEALKRNCALNGLSSEVRLNQLALGESEGAAHLYVFERLAHSRSSLSTLGRTDYTACEVPMITIDKYATANGITRVDLVKVDVEGAEMSVLRGAGSLFELDFPPIWVIEMNVETADNFGYVPSDLLSYVESHGDYRFYRIVGNGWGPHRPMSSLSDYQDGDNVICVPGRRISRWREVCLQ